MTYRYRLVAVASCFVTRPSIPVGGRNRVSRLATFVAGLGSLLVCSSASPTEQRVSDPIRPAYVQTPLFPPRRPFPPEQGRLHVEGRRFYDTNNRVWRWRGATEFLLFARYLNGEDIAPQLEWLVDRGFNVLRVFGEVPSGFGAVRMGIANYGRPFERPDFEAKLHAFFNVLEEHGLRCEYTVLTYPDAASVMRAHVQRVFDIAASHWNVMVEAANEPEYNRIDAVAVMQGVNRRGVLSAYGLDPARAGRGARVPVLDYGTTHDLQRDLEHSPYNTRDALDMQNALGVPFVNDEPIGAIDPGNPAFKENGPEMWGGINGGGARTVNRDLFISAAAIAYMYSAGYTFHFQRGLEGRVPTPADAVQDGVARALRDVAMFLPHDLQSGTPVEPGGRDFGLAWKNDPHAESRVNRAYGVVVGNHQWIVVPMPAPAWSPMPVNGWRVEEAGPVPYLLRLAKRQD
jgi:hypothetical protein